MPKSSKECLTKPVGPHPLVAEDFAPMAPLKGPLGEPWGCGGVGADPETTTDPIPGRFIRGLQGVEKDARERWQKTKKWRADEGIDYILEEPHPGYYQFKQCYPHFYHKQARTGEYLYIERCGQGKVEHLWKMGFELNQLARHYVWVSEYLWRMKDRDDDKMIISIFDLKGCTMGQLKGTQLSLFQTCSALIGDHFPERSRMTFVINAPWWISAAFAIIKPFMDARTFAKIKVLGGDYQKELLKYFDSENLPIELGGTDPCPLGEAPIEMEMRAHVKETNARFANLPTQASDPVDEDGFHSFTHPFKIPPTWLAAAENESTPGLRDDPATTPVPGSTCHEVPVTPPLK